MLTPRAPTEHSLRFLGLASRAHKLTVGVAVVSMGDAAEPLLASCVPDLQRQAQPGVRAAGLFPSLPPPPPPTSHLQLHLHAIHIQNFVLKDNQPALLSPAARTVLPPGGGLPQCRPGLSLSLSCPWHAPKFTHPVCPSAGWVLSPMPTSWFSSSDHFTSLYLQVTFHLKPKSWDPPSSPHPHASYTSPW